MPLIQLQGFHLMEEPKSFHMRSRIVRQQSEV